MKQTFLFISLILFIEISQAQKTDGSLPNVIKDTLYTTSGYKIGVKQPIKIGVGTMPDGTFKFIRVNQNSLLLASSDNRNGAISANAMAPSASGHQFDVLRLEWRGKPKYGFTYYVILKGTPRYEIDIENAIATGEIVVPDEFKPKTAGQMNSGTPKPSVADELTKLKKLYDDGVLTKDEYEAQKKKLLDQ